MHRSGSSTPAFALALLLAAGGSHADVAPTPRPVVIELFTSEGCSSCPPADGFLSDLARDQPLEGVELIVLSCHVTYWDSLGWRDPYGLDVSTALQRDYARRHSLRSVYTPQMVVDGVHEFVPSDRRNTLELLCDAARRDKLALSVTSEPVGTKRVRVVVGSDDLAAFPEELEIRLVLAEDDLRSRVERGENAGRVLRHDAVVRAVVTADGIGASNEVMLKLDRRWRRDRLRVVALAQEPGGGPIVGAAAARLTAPQ